MGKERTLSELRESIDDEVEFVDVKPYSHNIISLTLSIIAKQFGKEAANNAIEDYGLEKYGWKKEKE
jgi:hypothetical protein